MEKGGLQKKWEPRHIEIDKRQMHWYDEKVLNGTLNFNYYECQISEEDIKG